jgi:Fungal protein kinase
VDFSSTGTSAKELIRVIHHLEVLASSPVQYVTTISQCVFLDDSWQGTWRFMAADIVEDPTIHQTFVHDIESTFFVLLWMAINYVKSDWDITKRSSELGTIFDPPVYGDSGGSTKSRFMRGDFDSDLPRFVNNPPLTGLLIELRSLLSHRHYKQPQPVMGHNENPEKFKKRLERHTEHETGMKSLENYDAIIDCFKRSIEALDWPPGDSAEKQAVILSQAERYDLLSSSKRCRDAAPEGEASSRKRANIKSSPFESI